MASKELDAVRAAAEGKAAALLAFENSLREAVKVHTLAEVAQAAGLTRGRVSQIVGPVGRPAGRPARVPTVDVRRARLEDIDARWERFIDAIVPRFAMPEQDRKVEQARRNVHNARARRQQSGRRRDGKWSGASSAHKLVVLPTVTVETRAVAEKYALRLLEDRAGDAGVVEIVALLDEAESLREALEAESEAARGF